MPPPIHRTTHGMLAKKRAQVAGDRLKANAFREERGPLLTRLGEVDHLVRKYEWAVESGAVEVVEMMEKMSREKADDRRRAIAAEAMGKQQPYRAIATPDVAGPSRARALSPRGGAPRAISSPRGPFRGTIPKFRDGSVAQEERARHREACGYRGGSGNRSRSQSRRGGPRARGFPHKPYHPSSAGPRDANGDRVVTHPQQDRGRRAGQGQRARTMGNRSNVDSHGRSFGVDSTFDWSEEGQWDGDEGEE